MKYIFSDGAKTHTVELTPSGDVYSAFVDGQRLEIRIIASTPGEIALKVGDRTERVYWSFDGRQRWMTIAGKTLVLTSGERAPVERFGRRGHDPAHTGERIIVAPMPGHIRGVNVSEGAEVIKGQTLLLLEAMKMEIRIQAPQGGRLARLLVKPGQAVERDQVLGEIE